MAMTEEARPAMGADMLAVLVREAAALHREVLVFGARLTRAQATGELVDVTADAPWQDRTPAERDWDAAYEAIEALLGQEGKGALLDLESAMAWRLTQAEDESLIRLPRRIRQQAGIEGGPVGACTCEWYGRAKVDHDQLLEGDASAIIEMVVRTDTWCDNIWPDDVVHPDRLGDFITCHNWSDPVVMGELASALGDLLGLARDRAHRD